MSPITGAQSNPYDAYRAQFRAAHEQLASLRQAGSAANVSDTAQTRLNANEVRARGGAEEASAPLLSPKVPAEDRALANLFEAVSTSAETEDAGGAQAAEEDASQLAEIGATETEDAEAEEASAEGEGDGPNDLTEEEERVVRELSARDREVRAHEQAHATVGGQYAGSPSYTYQSGPDGKQYAIGGEVPIDISPVNGDPQATIDKMRVVIAAALAPAEPSGQDRKVASIAQSQQAQAYGELIAQRTEQQRGEGYDTRL